MTEANGRDTGQEHSARAIELRVAARLENLAVLRAAVTAIGTFEDLDFDVVSDLRLAVDEACTRLIRSASPAATLVLVVDPRPHELVIEASAPCETAEILSPGSFSWHVLCSLTDDVHTFHDGVVPGEPGRVFGIMLTTRRASPAR